VRDAGSTQLDRKSTDLEREAVLMARARRRLAEFQLIERAVLLGLTVLLTLAALVNALLGGGEVVTGSSLAGALSTAALVRWRSG
jgi:hypothetical protein